MGENVPQTGFAIDVVDLGGADHRVDGSGELPTLVGTGQGIVLAAGGERSDGPFSGIVVDVQSAAISISDERLPSP